MCKSCGVEKPLEQFKNEKRNSDGKTGKCLECIAKHKREYRKNHPDLVREQDRRRRNLPHVLEYQKKYVEENREELCKQARKRYETNKEPYLARSKEQKIRLGEKYNEYQKEYRKKNWQRLNEYDLNRYHKDVRRKLKQRISGGIRKRLQGRCKESHSIEYIGCTWEFLIGYIEAKFVDGMTWENFGNVWHLDHIMPCRAFDFNNEEEIKRCFHYSNLQPLFVVDNLKKLDRLPNGKLARYEYRHFQNRPDAVHDASARFEQ